MMSFMRDGVSAFRQSRLVPPSPATKAATSWESLAEVYPNSRCQPRLRVRPGTSRVLKRSLRTALGRRSGCGIWTRLVGEAVELVQGGGQGTGIRRTEEPKNIIRQSSDTACGFSAAMVAASRYASARARFWRPSGLNDPSNRAVSRERTTFSKIAYTMEVVGSCAGFGAWKLMTCTSRLLGAVKWISVFGRAPAPAITRS